ncbi:MAG TPA: septum formation initiator family protein [Longimicrobium sp.]|nr:septum formation initiator family protein [Longimicrobium sp.]
MALSPRGARRLLAGGTLLVAGYYAIWGGEYSAWDLVTLRRERVVATERLAHTRAEVDSLRARATRLERQDSAVERIARERFGMIRDGETLYRFVPVDPAAAAPARP